MMIIVCSVYFGKAENYRTDAIKRHLIPEEVTPAQSSIINAVLIDDGMPQGERLIKLNQIAIQQMKILEDSNNSRKLLK